MFQDIRTFSALDLANPACSAASPCTAMPTYTDAVDNSFTTSYMTGGAVAKAQGKKIPVPFAIQSWFAAGAAVTTPSSNPVPVRPCRLPAPPVSRAILIRTH